MDKEYIFQQLHYIVKNVRFDGRLVLAMGSRNNVRIISTFFKNYGLKIQAILDNSDQLKGTVEEELKIFKPEDILIPYKEKALIFLLSPAYSSQMRMQLEQLGYKENVHFFVIDDEKRENDLTRYLKREISRARKGGKLYNSIMRECGSDCFLFFLRGATGDVFLNGLYIKEYVRNKGIDNYVVLGDAKGLRKVIGLFNTNRVYALTFEQAEAFQKYITVVCPSNVKDVFMWQGSLYFNRCQVRMHEMFNFLDTYTYYIYEGLANKETWDKPKFRNLDESMCMHYEELGINRGKTVIVSPYAYSVKQLPIWFWDEIALELKNKGYEVFVNINEAVEINPFENMKSVFFAFDECDAILTYAGYFLALRSGLCDIVSLVSTCKQVIVYPEPMSPIDYRVHRSDAVFSGFETMGFDCNHITEISSKLVLDVVKPDTYFSIFEQNELYLELKKQILEQF